MLNFAEQTGSGAVIVVWSFLTDLMVFCTIKSTTNTNKQKTGLGSRWPASGHRDPSHKPTTEPSKAPASTPSCYPESRQVTITPR